jgi:hypothetical protein
VVKQPGWLLWIQSRRPRPLRRDWPSGADLARDPGARTRVRHRTRPGRARTGTPPEPGSWSPRRCASGPGRAGRRGGPGRAPQSLCGDLRQPRGRARPSRGQSRGTRQDQAPTTAAGAVASALLLPLTVVSARRDSRPLGSTCLGRPPRAASGVPFGCPPALADFRQPPGPPCRRLASSPSASRALDSGDLPRRRRQGQRHAFRAGATRPPRSRTRPTRDRRRSGT